MTTPKKTKRITPEQAVEALRPLDDPGTVIDWENLDWQPEPLAAAQQKSKQAQEYQDYLKERIAARKLEQENERRRMLADRGQIGDETRRHPSMLEEDHPLAALKAKAAPKAKLRLVSAKDAEKWWITESRRNIAAFMIFVWGLKPAPHHIMWFKQMLNPMNDKTIIVGPRGSAKSTAALVFISWYMGHFPHKANTLISVTLKQAQDRLETIRDTILHNERYRRVFPNIDIDHRRPNNKTALNVCRTDIPYGAWRSFVTRNSDPKSPSLFASGVGGSQVIGSRCTGILLLDDLMDERNVATSDMRDKLWVWVSQTLMPILTKDARAVHITTRWHTDDLVVRQIATGEWSHSYTRALIRGARGQLQSYWPQQFSIKRLLSIRKLVGGPIFKIMYMCLPTSLAGELFEIDQLRNALPEERPAYRRVFVSVDPALKTKQQSDDTAIAVVGVPHSMDEMHILELYTGKWRPETTAARISAVWARAWERYGIEPDLVLETVGGMEIFITLLRSIGVVNLQKLIPNTPNVDKWTRALPLASIAELGNLYFDTSMPRYNKAVSQLLEFNGKDGNADDIVDALSQVAKIIRGSVRAALRQATMQLVDVPGML